MPRASGLLALSLASAAAVLSSLIFLHFSLHSELWSVPTKYNSDLLLFALVTIAAIPSLVSGFIALAKGKLSFALFLTIELSSLALFALGTLVSITD